jgi:hypothetical protein
MTLDRTGRTTLVAKRIGTFSLAGAQMKVSAVEVEVFVLACDPDVGGCGWSVDGYVSDGALIPLGDKTPPQGAPDRVG